MPDFSDAFFAASPSRIAVGYARDRKEGGFRCLICGLRAEAGRIYRIGDGYYKAGRYIARHVKDEHGSVLDYLLGLDRRLTGITEQQRELIGRFGRGESDKDIAASMGIAASTVRNHRFALREKARQARLFLAAMKIADGRRGEGEDFMPIRRSATMVDERYVVTASERDAIIGRYFEGEKLKEFPVKQKRKLVVLGRIAERFESGRRYAEKEVNEIIQGVYDDYAAIRRYLIEYGIMDREPGGGAYWLKE